MDEQHVYAALTEIFREIFDDPEIVAAPEMSAKDVPEWDSFNHINIVVAAEMRFGIKFRAAEIDNLRNVGEFVALITRKREAA
ncbi:MAG TPA: acyl carrier protein [Ferrovibrio sp.]|uniref:acyl carrier protein n=1 Tax=Ferrovibrio sp. TaxID=1917215 RepID=UPI002ED1D7FE